MLRHALSDQAWNEIRSLFPPRPKTGRPPRSSRSILEGVLWILRTGAPWRDLPRRFGPWQTTYGRFRTWVRAGVFERVHLLLLRRLVRSERFDREVWCVDTTVIRASRAAAGAQPIPGEPEHHALGRSRGGFGTKLSLVCDGSGTPLAIELGPGQEHDIRGFEAVMAAALRVGRPRCLTADKAYSVKWVRDWIRRRGVVPVIPVRRDQEREPAFDPEVYRKRNVVERLISWLKESRRVATRYEKLAETYRAMVTLALVCRVLRGFEFSNRA